MNDDLGHQIAQAFTTAILKGFTMKFTDLTSAQRSTLAALRSTDRLRTDALGRGCSPQLTAQRSAANLLEMRKLGLVYSVQKPEGQQYAEWSITAFGQAVFDGRPHDVTPTDVAEITGGINAQAMPQSAPDHAPRKRWILSCGRANDVLQDMTRDDAFRRVQELATNVPGREFRLYEQVAAAYLAKPEPPVASITLL